MTLQFTRDGKRLIARSASGVQLLDTEGAPPIQLVDAPVQEVAVVGQEIWIVEASTPVLRRFDARGNAIGATRILWGNPGEGRLIQVGAGGAGALWTASPPAIVRAQEAETVRVPGDADLVVPVSAARWVTCQRRTVTVSEPTAERWREPLIAESQHAIDGATLFDGRAAALLAADDRTGAARQLLVVSLHAPVVQHRLTLVDVEAVRLAILRGFVLFRAGARLTLMDLRFGRVVGEHVSDRPIAEVAIDAAARDIALRWADTDELVLVPAGALFTAPARGILAGAGIVEAAAIEPATEAGETAEAPPINGVNGAVPAPVVAAFHRGPELGSCAALLPRRHTALADPTRVETWLDAYLKLIAAQAGRAIAVAWDAGRLSFPTDGGLPYKTEVGGLLGRSAKLAPQDVGHMTAEVAVARAALRTVEAQLGNCALPLDALAAEFGLSPLAKSIMMTVAAPAFWGEMARLYGILSNDDDRVVCDELLVCQLLTDDARRSEIARELDHDAPLIRHGLLQIAETGMRPFLGLSVEPIVLRRWRARDAAEELEDIRIMHTRCAFDDFLTPAAVKATIIRAVATRPAGGPPRIIIRGRLGSGRHTLLAILAQAAGRTLGVIDAAPVIREPRTRGPRLQAALRRAHVLGMLPCIDGLEHIASDDQVMREVVRELLRAHPGPLAVRLPWDAEPTLEPGYIAIDLPALDGPKRGAAWADALGRSGLFVRDVDELANRYGVGVGVMMRTAEHVSTAQAGEAASAVAPPDAAPALESAIRQHLVTRLRTTASRIGRLATWSQVIMPPDVQTSILELIARIKHHSTVYDRWGFDRLTTSARGVTALFQGGPGTGKTLVATAIANELGMDLYRVDLSRIMSKWIGETEQNLAKLFDAAEDGHAIILFDEADSLFAKRTEVRSSVDRYANLEVNFLLQRLDSFEGAAILTTNFGTAIDTAFKRRLSFRLTFPFPDEDMRERLWRAHLPPELPRTGEFDLGMLARRFRLSGGFIRNAVLRAAFLAAEEHVPMTQEHLEHAIRAEFSEIGKLSESGILE